MTATIRSPAVPVATPTKISSPARSARARTALLLIGILLVAVNLRAAITSVGALLGEVTGSLGLTTGLASVLTMLPAVTFAAFGIVTPRLTTRFGAARVLALAMGALFAGQLARALTSSVAVFFATSALALAGIAVANVLLPGLVRQLFPRRAGIITGAYTMTMIAGTSIAAAASVPIADAAGSWRFGLGVWALFAAMAALPWLAVSGRPSSAAPAAPAATVRPARTRLGWAMAIYFGTQALSGYALMGWLAQLFRDAGYSPAGAGLMLAGVTAIGVPVALLMPAIAVRRGDVRTFIVAMTVASVLAYAGLAFAPQVGLLWVTLLAIGQGGFPLALALLGMRARDNANVVALSAFAQSAGYLFAAIGPLFVGFLYGATGAWYAPLGFLGLILVVQTMSGLAVARPRYLEDAA